MKVATFTVRATVVQSARWKIAAESEGFPSVGAWAALALDAYLKVRARAGVPVPLAWRHGLFRVRLGDDREPEVRGWVSPPFGAFHGSPDGPLPHGATHCYSLVYIPERRIVATLRTFRECRALGAELARSTLGGEPPGRPAEEALRAFR